MFKKGTFFYEIQILMFVIMWQHDLSYKPLYEETGLVIGRLYIWKDRLWRLPMWFYNLMAPINSVRNYIYLHRHGFRISRTRSLDGRFDINRFYWHKDIIENMADLDRVDGEFYTMYNGRSTPLSEKGK